MTSVVDDMFFNKLADQSFGVSITRLILGIGNIGSEYEGTRHNIGFDTIDILRERMTNEKRMSGFHAEYFTGTLPSGEKVVLVKPQTYVNRSGVAAKALLDHFGLAESSMVVLVDDFHIRLGTLRIRSGGSAGGHNGLKSLIASCGEGFSRVRIGIGPLPENTDIVDFVLGRFESDQVEEKKNAVLRASDATLALLSDGVEVAMNRFNN